MPIYEEKLICPLAVRFTQDHIRPQFRDGREVEAAVHEVKANPGIDDYDFVLEAPFPTIEIIRWSQFDAEAVGDDADHWFTLDNRRLYCLQKKAAALWPKRCAARVEVLYAAGHRIKRKGNSLTAGRDVAIRHSARDDRWDWRAFVHPDLSCSSLGGLGELEVSAAQKLVSRDDHKVSVGELVDAPQVPSLISLYLQGCCAIRPEELATKLEPVAQVDNASTDTGSSDVSVSSSSPRALSVAEAAWETSEDFVAALHKVLIGSWAGNKGEAYEVTESSERATWVCVRTDAYGYRKSYTLWYDEKSDCISWGIDWSYYAYAAELLNDPSTFRWFGGRSSCTEKPRFVWHHPSKSSRSTSKIHPVVARYRQKAFAGKS